MAYADGHLAGSVSIMIGKQFSNHVSWVIPWGAPITLIAAGAEQVAEARRQLARIDMDHLTGAAVGPLDRLACETPIRSYERVSFEDVARAANAVLLDVRRDDEVRDGHIAHAKHISLHTLLDRLHEVPTGKVWVHSTTGLGAGVAASILDRAGFAVFHVDDDYVNAVKAGLPTVAPSRHAVRA